MNVATGPLKATVATALIDTGVAVSGASATFRSNGVCWLVPSLFFQLIVAVVDALLGVGVRPCHLPERVDRALRLGCCPPSRSWHVVAPIRPTTVVNCCPSTGWNSS